MDCWLRPHAWRHVVNAEDSEADVLAGVYQCTRCKELSIGAPRERQTTQGPDLADSEAPPA